MCEKITRTVIESLTSSFSTCSWHALRRASACLEKETTTHQVKIDSYFAKSTTKHNMIAKDEPLVTWRAFEDRSSRNSFCRKYPKFFGSHRAPWNKRMEWKKLKYESQMGYSNIYFFLLAKRFFFKEMRQIVVGVSCNFYRSSHRLWLVICRRTTLVRDAVMI